jgi:hypothetical protein
MLRNGICVGVGPNPNPKRNTRVEHEGCRWQCRKVTDVLRCVAICHNDLLQGRIVKGTVVTALSTCMSTFNVGFFVSLLHCLANSKYTLYTSFLRMRIVTPRLAEELEQQQQQQQRSS